MKPLKYGLSGLAMAALTLLFLCVPALYYRLTDRETATVSTRDIHLEQTAEPLTPSQALRLLRDNAGTASFLRCRITGAATSIWPSRRRLSKRSAGRRAI